MKYNARILGSSVSGVQRYLKDFTKYLPEDYSEIRPKKTEKMSGLKGHLWEQFILPTLVKGDLLWSPSNTGPLSYSNQVVTIHDAVSFDHPEWLNPNFVKFYTTLQPRLAKRVQKVVTISNFSKERLIKHLKIDDSRIEVIYNGVDKNFFTPKSDEKEKSKLTDFVGSGEYLLTLSTIEPRKNLAGILEAWKRISSSLKDVKLVIVGKQGKSTVFKNADIDYETSGIKFTGYVPDDILPILYRNAKAFIYIPFYEGFGLPPLEAMSTGTPVITSNCTSIPEVVGEAAIKVDPHNTSEVADTVFDLLKDESALKRLTTLGLERSEMFKIQDKAKELGTIFKRLGSE